MSNLHNLPSKSQLKKKRKGRGLSSGKGKTSGRGTKGQRAREKVKKTSGPGSLAFIKRLPLFRGKYRNKPSPKKPIVVNVKYLNLLPKNSKVDIDLLIKSHIVDEDEAKKFGVKILGDGEIKVPLILNLPCSKGAAKKITSAGGKVEYNG